MKPKTIRQWLNTLPEPLRKSAINSMNKKIARQWLTENHCADKLSNAILYGFEWQRTEEGVMFWYSFHEALVWAEQEN